LGHGNQKMVSKAGVGHIASIGQKWWRRQAVKI